MMHSSYPCGLVLQEVARSGAGAGSWAQKTWELVSVMPCSVALVRALPFEPLGTESVEWYPKCVSEEVLWKHDRVCTKKGGRGSDQLSLGKPTLKVAGLNGRAFLSSGCAGMCCKSLGALNPMGSISIWPHAGLRLHYLEHIGTSWTRPVVATEFPRPWTDVRWGSPSFFQYFKKSSKYWERKITFIHDKNSAW